ncbi:MAG TPA: hypothetical protein VN578_06880 [Candidatus Binatia bacterium]|nr:hypothetical protein [Candidatus Binatia bacterium]
MKTLFAKHGTVRGSVLVIALGIIFVLGLGLSSYLLLMRWQYVSVTRSQAWNAALSMAEAGAEEALAQLNPSALLFSTNINSGANGWSLLSDGMYHAPRGTLTDGYYDVAITADTLPTIYSTGYVTIPSLSATLYRTLKVGTGFGSLFRGPMAARVNVDLKGNKITTDSFDSLDPAHSTNGLYDPAKRKAGGDVATTLGVINVQNANIMGTLYTAPGGSFTIGPQGSVGDVAWVSGGQSGVEAGHYKNDFNMDFPDVLPPYQTGLPPVDGTVGGTNYTWVLGNGNYMYTQGNGANFNSDDTILVQGSARVYVTGNFVMHDGASIIIAPGASLELYVGGANTSISTVYNAGNCATFNYFGLPGNTSIGLTGNASFLGTIYAPNANLTLSGGGNNTLDYQGAVSVNTISMNGHFNFHFDENLKRSGPMRGYQITSWGEN